MDVQTHELKPRSHVRDPHIVGVVPRSIYEHDAEEKAWTAAIAMARGRPRPTFVVGNRRVLGLTFGRPPGRDPRVLVQRFHSRTTAREMFRAREDMWHAGFPDSNVLVNALSAGQFGRTYFAKTPTSTGVANNWYDLWPVGGNPTSGLINGTAKTAVQFTDASQGALNHRGNVTPATKHMLSKAGITTANTPWLMAYDRVIAYDRCPFAAGTNQTMTNTLTAQRYNSGAPGLLPIVVTNTVHGATAANMTQYSYTNQSGTAGQLSPTTTTLAFIASAAAPTATLGARVSCPSTSTFSFGFSMPLQQGDSGVRSTQNYTTSAANTGTWTNALIAPLTDLLIPVAAVPTEADCVFQLSELQQIFDSACVGLMALQPATAGYQVTGSLRYGWN